MGCISPATSSAVFWALAAADAALSAFVFTSAMRSAAAFTSPCTSSMASFRRSARSWAALSMPSAVRSSTALDERLPVTVARWFATRTITRSPSFSFVVAVQGVMMEPGPSSTT